MNFSARRPHRSVQSRVPTPYSGTPRLPSALALTRVVDDIRHMKRAHTVTIILNGDVETCCSFTLASEVAPTVQAWVADSAAVTVHNLEDGPWEHDAMGAYARELFGEQAYPLVYVDGTLTQFGALPTQKSIMRMLSPTERDSLSREDMEKAARAMGLR